MSAMNNVKQLVSIRATAEQKGRSDSSSRSALAGDDEEYLSITPLNAQSRQLISRSVSVVASANQDEKADAKEQTSTDLVSIRNEKLFSIKNLMAKSLSLKGQRFQTRLGSVVAVNFSASAAKYTVQWATNATLLVNSLVNSQEWSSWDSVFDEFFVKRMNIKYVPVNKYSANSSASTSSSGSPGYVNTVGAVIAAFQHSQAAPADASTNASSALNVWNHKVVDLGSPFLFRWKNVENFDWNGPVGDQSASRTGQGWCTISAATLYGGQVWMATPEATGASAGVGTLTESGVPGHAFVTWDIAFRVRS